MTECPDCNFLFRDDIPENVAQHEKHHEICMLGVRDTMQPNQGPVIWRDMTSRIIVVTPFSSLDERDLAGKAALAINLDPTLEEPRFDGTGFVIYNFDGTCFATYEEPDERNVHVFLHLREDRVVGFLLFEKRTHIWQCTWKQDDSYEFVAGESVARWSVGRIWVHHSQRRSGLASHLLLQAISFLKSDFSAIGWVDPFTPSGKALARKLYPDGFTIAK